MLLPTTGMFSVSGMAPAQRSLVMGTVTVTVRHVLLEQPATGSRERTLNVYVPPKAGVNVRLVEPMMPGAVVEPPQVVPSDQSAVAPAGTLTDIMTGTPAVVL